MATTGDAIRVSCDFKTFTGNYADPIEVKFSVYDLAKTKIGNTLVLGEDNKVDVGKYEIDYIIPKELESMIDTKTEYIVLEFEGLLENTSVVSRKKLPINWAT